MGFHPGIAQHSIKALLVWLAILAGPVGRSQESTQPLHLDRQRSSVSPSAPSPERARDCLRFIHQFDTLELPFRDDFSTDKFKHYNADTTDPGAKDTAFYLLFDQSGQPLPPNTEFMETPTFRYSVDTIDGDTLLVDTTALPSESIVLNDTNAFPAHKDTLIEAWPTYELFDTLWNGRVDTNFFPEPDLEQGRRKAWILPPDSTSHWIDRFAFLNATYPESPPTVGVATLDGLDEMGQPYDFSDKNAYGWADELTSAPLDLSFLPQDSVFLSFFYQPEGIGNAPESKDSLVLEFRSPDSSSWDPVWSAKGREMDDSGRAFQQEIMAITDPGYLKKGFQFRFRNRATLSGSFDHWHIDYVKLNENRGVGDTLLDDVAFRYKEHSLIRTFTAMPWKHFKVDPVNFMKDSLITHQKNLSTTAKLMSNRMRIKHNGNVTNDLPHPLNPSIQPRQNFNTIHSIGSTPNEFVYDTSFADTSAYFQVELMHNTSPDANRNNDTIRFTQRLTDRYAYDDGTAEVGYGVLGNSVKIAVSYDLPIQDTLIGLRIHFTPAFKDVSDESFFVTVWDGAGAPGNIIHQNFTFHSPKYPNGPNRAAYYPLDSVIEVDGRIHVGFQQTTKAKLNIGMDRNINTRKKIWFNTSENWENTSFEGSLMIRPVFAAGNTDRIIGINERAASSVPDPKIYPNPADQRFRVSLNSGRHSYSYRLVDLTGRSVRTGRFTSETELKVQDLDNGLYLLKLRSPNGGTRTKKVLIRH